MDKQTVIIVLGKHYALMLELSGKYTIYNIKAKIESPNLLPLYQYKNKKSALKTFNRIENL